MTKALKMKDKTEGLLSLATKAVDQAIEKLAVALSNDPTPEAVTHTYAAIKDWSKTLENVGKIASGILKSTISSQGEKTTDKGTMQLQVGNFQLEMRPHKTGLDAKKVEALLQAKELSLDKYMDKEIRYKLNETRLRTAIAEGDLTEDEISTCNVEVTYSLQPPKRIS